LGLLQKVERKEDEQTDEAEHSNDMKMLKDFIALDQDLSSGVNMEKKYTTSGLDTNDRKILSGDIARFVFDKAIAKKN